ncbi:MAG: flagellar export chaperone FliS [Rickettsiales bacterium]|jgi:flagellar protein FliS|nr:flagellar export chaperone FliS [Rickettsiales bacterium]
MTSRQKYQAYASATQTVAKTKQIVLLYDAVIRYLQQVKEAISEKRIEDRYNLLIKASEIIFGLQSCLDFENGKDIARILYNFYSSIDSRVFSIHRSASLQMCDEVIAELKQMRDVWHEIDQGGDAGGDTPAAITPPSEAAASDVATIAPTPDKPVSLSA